MNRVVKRAWRAFLNPLWFVYGRLLPGTYNKLSRCRYSGHTRRRLDIGCGAIRIEGFETLNVVPRYNVDYVADASKRLPFDDGTFEMVHASHILEHIPWYKVEDTLREWVRILRRGGVLEVWVPDGLKVCKTLVDAELYGHDVTHLDGWYKFNSEQDPCVWAAGRLFTYGDGKGTLDHPNWHRALFTPRYLKLLLERVGLQDVRIMESHEVRGAGHGWLNLGVMGVKK